MLKSRLENSNEPLDQVLKLFNKGNMTKNPIRNRNMNLLLYLILGNARIKRVFNNEC